MVSQGKGKVTVGSEKKELSKNDITLAPSGEDHGVMNDSGAKLVLLVLCHRNPIRLAT